MIKCFIYIIIILLSISCFRNDSETNTSISNEVITEDDKIIKDVINLETALEEVDISQLKGLTIHFRSVGEQPYTLVYFVGRVDFECSPYIVVYNSQFNKIIEIDNSLVIKFGCDDYLDKNTIKSCVCEYQKLKSCVLKVDSLENIYVNIHNQEMPNLLRIKDISKLPDDITEFRQIYDNWYVRK